MSFSENASEEVKEHSNPHQSSFLVEDESDNQESHQSQEQIVSIQN